MKPSPACLPCLASPCLTTLLTLVTEDVLGVRQSIINTPDSNTRF